MTQAKETIGGRLTILQRWLSSLYGVLLIFLILLTQLEKILKKPKGRKPRTSGTESQEAWVTRTQDVFAALDRSPLNASTPPLPTGRMTLRDRKRGGSPSTTPSSSAHSPSQRNGPLPRKSSLQADKATETGSFSTQGVLTQMVTGGTRPRVDDDVLKSESTEVKEDDDLSGLPSIPEEQSGYPLMIKIKIPLPRASQ